MLPLKIQFYMQLPILLSTVYQFSPVTETTAIQVQVVRQPQDPVGRTSEATTTVTEDSETQGLINGDIPQQDGESRSNSEPDTMNEQQNSVNVIPSQCLGDVSWCDIERDSAEIHQDVDDVDGAEVPTQAAVVNDESSKSGSSAAPLPVGRVYCGPGDRSISSCASATVTSAAASKTKAVPICATNSSTDPLTTIREIVSSPMSFSVTISNFVRTNLEKLDPRCAYNTPAWRDFLPKWVTYFRKRVNKIEAVGVAERSNADGSASRGPGGYKAWAGLEVIRDRVTNLSFGSEESKSHNVAKLDFRNTYGFGKGIVVVEMSGVNDIGYHKFGMTCKAFMRRHAEWGRFVNGKNTRISLFDLLYAISYWQNLLPLPGQEAAVMETNPGQPGPCPKDQQPLTQSPVHQN